MSHTPNLIKDCIHYIKCKIHTSMHMHIHTYIIGAYVFAYTYHFLWYFYSLTLSLACWFIEFLFIIIGFLRDQFL